MLFPSLLLVLFSSALAWECPEVTPSVCGEDELTCDRGYHNYCWTGDYCLPARSVCPQACYTSSWSYSQCSPSHQLTCESWVGHCKYGEYCMEAIAGQVCPPSCRLESPAICLDTDVVCDLGYDEGCWLGQSCMPAGSECPQ